MIQITIPGELTDLNSYIAALNANRYSGNQIKRSETELVAMIAKTARVKPITAYPVKITYIWYSKDQRKDIDNVAFAKKFINDGLVMAGILENDSRKFISSFSDVFAVDKENPRVEVILN